MPITLRDILIDIEHSDFRFENPVPLTDDKGQHIGHAELEHRSDRIYAVLYFDGEDSFVESYPTAVINFDDKIITSILLSSNPNKDTRIEKVIDQELFQASAGAGNADLK